MLRCGTEEYRQVDTYHFARHFCIGAPHMFAVYLAHHDLLSLSI